MCTTQEVLKTYAVGFFGAVAALLVGAAVWFAVLQPIDRPGLVWGGTVYSSKQEFSLYLKSKSLSYSTWLKRNPGIAPWEPGTRAANAGRIGQAWDWKRDTLLAIIAALLATIAAALVARAPSHGEPVKRRAATREERGSLIPCRSRHRNRCARSWLRRTRGQEKRPGWRSIEFVNTVGASRWSGSRRRSSSHWPSGC